jgi:hypothetical protein
MEDITLDKQAIEVNPEVVSAETLFVFRAALQVLSDIAQRA